MSTLTKTQALPKILTFNEAKYYIFSVFFVSSAVFFPWLAHQFHIAGPTFLPMHFFVMIAGFLFGWRTGLLVGVVSPLMSFSITHMPPAAILAETTLELGVYGFVVGILRERGFNIWRALILSMILGRIARLIFVLSFGLKTNLLDYFKMSWPGIILQILLIPLIIALLERYVFERKNEERV